MIHRFFRLLRLDGFTPSQKIAISFIFVIFFGAMLLMMPFSNQNGAFFPFLDALFISASAVCVTGLTVVAPADQFTLFGQIVLLMLIQIGGLGLMTLVATFAIGIRKRLSIQNKIAMREMLNQSKMPDFKRFLFGIVKYTFFFEIIGTFLLCIKFIPEFGLSKGFFVSIFTAISAFCNAGFDIIGPDSLLPYVHDVVVNFTVMGLIVAGGLGFIVYFDLRDKLTLFIKRKISFKTCLKRLMLQTKIVLVVTTCLIFIPAILIFMMEAQNMNSIGGFQIDEKIYASLFTSVTLRTAGFATVNSIHLTTATQFLMVICMFIGGSPGGTAGGIKTTTLAVIILCVWCNIRGRDKTTVFHRHISRDIIVRATTVVAINVAVLFTGILLLLAFTNFNFMEIVFEAVSALATVGLSLSITPLLPPIGKIIIIVLMFVGRIGIITFVVSLIRKESREVVDYAEGHVMIG